MRRFLGALGVAALVVIGFGLGLFYPTLRGGAPEARRDAVVEGVAPEGVSIAVRESPLEYVEVRADPPADDEVLLVFYPGGLVDPAAYTWIGVALAPLGVRTAIPSFPFDLAVAAPGRAGVLLDALDPAGAVILGGHSLGGAMAVRYADDHRERLDGLLLMGAYGEEGRDLSGADLETLVLAAEHDGLATPDEIARAATRLPPSTNVVEIRGAVHAFFGRYGPQRGDGVPTVTRARAEEEVVAAIASFVARIRAREPG